MRKFDFPSLIFWLIDMPVYLLLLLVNKSLIDESVKKEKMYFIENTGAKEIDFVNTMLGAIHTRASTAISHISIMMGVTVLLLLKSSDIPQLKFFMIIEVCIYVSLLVLCLRCMRSLSLNDGEVHPDFSSIYDNEIIERFAIQQIINAGLAIATIGFLALVLSYAKYV